MTGACWLSEGRVARFGRAVGSFVTGPCLKTSTRVEGGTPVKSAEASEVTSEIIARGLPRGRVLKWEDLITFEWDLQERCG